MHDETLEWVIQSTRDGSWPRIIEIGSRDVNGSLRSLFPDADLYYGIDIAPGPGVDYVVDASDWKPDFGANLVLCTEVFEHTPLWPVIMRTIARAMLPDVGSSRAVMTMATDPREPHSGVDGGPLREDEYYCNVSEAAFTTVLAALFQEWTVDRLPRGDLRAVAESPRLENL